MEFGNQSIPMPANDNERGGLKALCGDEPRGLSAGKNVDKRHGRAFESHGMRDGVSRISATELMSTNEREAQKIA